MELSDSQFVDRPHCLQGPDKKQFEGCGGGEKVKGKIMFSMCEEL
jgi:hypothetical protein